MMGDKTNKHPLSGIGIALSDEAKKQYADAVNKDDSEDEAGMPGAEEVLQTIEGTLDLLIRMGGKRWAT